jgi:hypothetical protein
LKDSLCQPPVDSRIRGLKRGPRSGYFFILATYLIELKIIQTNLLEKERKNKKGYPIKDLKRLR